MKNYHPAFDTISEKDLPEYRARGIYLRHRRTGCEVYRVLADDSENAFAFVFKTPSRNGTGVAHIVEHSVLCGSKNYPVKDPFLVMARRSLATFLNALTYPDKTMYPAASSIRSDFYNLLSVYADAVFFPNLTEETFLQEAHRLEYGSAGVLERKGVVYNEMRGDYSSADSLAGTFSSTSLFEPGHPYSYDSGGDPERIPDLSYSAFKDYWAEHYHPSNCRVYLYGDLDLSEELEFLEKGYLSHFEARTIATEIPLQRPFLEPRRIAQPYPVMEGAEAGTQIVVNWLTAPITDEIEALGLEMLAEILLGHDGAPLAHALRSSGLGEDLSPQCGVDTLFRQILFSAGLRGTARGKEAELEALILNTLSTTLEQGFDPDAREAAKHSIVFANKEIRRGSTTFGLRLLNRSLRGWLHGAGPEATLSFETALSGLEKRIEENPRYLEGLARCWLVENKHRSTVTVYPEAGLLERRKDEETRRLQVLEQNFSVSEKELLRRRTAELAQIQDEADSPEHLDLLPKVRITDIPPQIEIIPREKALLDTTELSLHPIFSNGIIYLDMAFPIDGLSHEEKLWLPFLSRSIAGAGLPGLSYAKVAAELARNTGGFGAMLEAGSSIDTSGGGQSKAKAYMIIRLKALAERFPKALELALRLLTEADYTDYERFRDLLAELGNDIMAALIPSGNSFALARAGALMNETLAIEELWRGPSQILFVQDLRDSNRIEAHAASLSQLSRGIFHRQGLRLNLTASQELLPAAVAELSSAIKMLPSRSSVPMSTGTPLQKPGSVSSEPSVAISSHEAYAVSAQIGFAAAACRASKLGSPGFVHESVLAHLLTTGSLWEELRVRRGAYGAYAYLEALEGVALFSTYRDPSPVKSLEFFEEALQALSLGRGLELTEDAVIGTAGRDIKPLLPEEKSMTDFRRELFGITDEIRQEKRAALLATTPEDLQRAAERLAAAYTDSASVLISHAEDVQLASRTRSDTRVIELPR